MAVERLVTATELERMEGGKRFELARGRLVPVTPAGDRHGQAAVILAAELREYVRKHRLGRVRAETGFYLSRNPDTVRGPDVSFVAVGRSAGERSSQGFIAGPPDLAVEILSPSNTSIEVAQKVAEYLAAGSRLVWVLDIEERAAYVHRPGERRRLIEEHGHLDGEDVVPGFSYALKALFEELA